MAPTKRIRPQLGDVIEIPTPSGFAYAQFTHKHPRYGALIRVLPGLFLERPSEFAQIVEEMELFVAFFPLGPACNREIVKVVAEEKIPSRSSKFPTFRTGVRTQDGEVHCWWLWDGESEWMIGKLKPEQHLLPIRGIWNDTLLIERILAGWRPEFEI
jgi:hypothetical protein